ncbi:MAG: glycosyltransferase [Candidatus Eremiobacteraeota bacterium]|nr:glycosyltransferase [Candidatus Eremiobacteraeota bacterium]
MHPRSSAIDVAFVAAHLLTPTLFSGGDVLFANIAREMAQSRPDWRIAVIAPEYACNGLAPFFRTVVPLPSHTGEEGAVRDPFDVALRWGWRMRACARAARLLAPRLLHATGDFFVDVLPAAWAARRLGACLTGVVHHLNAPPQRRRNDFIVASGSWLLQGVSLGVLRARADHVFLLNDDTRRALRSRGFRATQLVVGGAGIDLAKFPLAPDPGSHGRVLWVHRLEPTKGVFDLPRLAALLPSTARIDVVGRGPRAWRERLQTELQRAGVVDRVILHDYVDEGMLVQLYAAARVFVSCSYEEGWGISLAEALATGVPCVAYALPSHAEIFGDAVTTVPVGDVGALARQITQLLQTPDGPEARLRRRAVVEPYSFRAVAERQVAVLAPLLDGERRTS